MKRPKQTDAIVVGAGPVGLFTALCLRKHRLDVEIFDTLPRSSTHSYALALHPESLSLLDKLGVLNRIEGRMRRMRRIAIHRGREQVAELDLSAIAGLDHPFVAVIPQCDLECALVEALREVGVAVHWSHRISQIEDAGRRVHATASEIEERTLGYAIGHAEQFVRRKHQVEAEFLVGADGHDSFVRRFLGIDFPETGPAQRFAVFEFRGKGLDDDTMQIFSGENGLVSVQWPLGDDTWRWSFEVAQDFTTAEEEREKDSDLVQLANLNPYPMLDRDDLQALIRERAPWCSTSVDNLYWRLLVRFEKRLAARLGEGRIWLAGDAAHLAGPVGVQSMNVGLREGHDLAGRIAAVTDARASLDIFEEYNRERLAEWRFLLGLTGGARPGPTVGSDLAALAPFVSSWLPASGYKLVSVARRLGFEIEDMPVGAGNVGDAGRD